MGDSDLRVNAFLGDAGGCGCVLAVRSSHWLGFEYPWLRVLASLLIVSILPLLLLILAIALVVDGGRLIDVTNTALSTNRISHLFSWWERTTH